ncbi:MAG: hypothetical protein IKQ34_04365 [Bacilli bacterium]|nr:hypothetical protein [Bacilli bacterium]
MKKIEELKKDGYDMAIVTIGDTVGKWFVFPFKKGRKIDKRIWNPENEIDGKKVESLGNMKYIPHSGLGDIDGKVMCDIDDIKDAKSLLLKEYLIPQWEELEKEEKCVEDRKKRIETVEDWKRKVEKSKEDAIQEVQCTVGWDKEADDFFITFEPNTSKTIQNKIVINGGVYATCPYEMLDECKRKMAEFVLYRKQKEIEELKRRQKEELKKELKKASQIEKLIKGSN